MNKEKIIKPTSNFARDITLAATPMKKEELYKDFLQNIENVNLTLREIDVIACIIHNRGEKKIASLLSISYRTVSVHVRNIMNKFGYNSRENILDLIERSGKLRYLQEYYFQLKILSFFEKQLDKIAKSLNRDKLYYKFNYYDLTEKEENLIKYLNQHLSIANIDSATKRDSYKIQNIHILGEESSNLSSIMKNDLVIIIGGDTEKALIEDNDWIDFRDDKEYYFLLFKLIEKLLYEKSLKQIIKEFQSEYINLQESWSGVGKNKDTDLNFISKRFDKKILISVGLIFVLSFVVCKLINNHYKASRLARANQEMQEFVASFSFDNIGITESLKNNVDHLKKISQTIDNIEHEYMLNCIKDGSISTQELLNYLYSLNAVAMNTMYNKYDKFKARKFLIFAKNAVELYIISDHNSHINFAELSPEEIYTELSVVDSLPETYTRILYLLGRTYTYFEEYNRSDFLLSDFDDDENFVRYYEISAYLGKKLNLFEGFLSIRNGMEMVRLFAIKDHIRKGEKQEAEAKIFASLELLKRMKDDYNPYIIDYRPGNNIKQKKVIPGEDNYCKLFITERIINHYARLIKLTDDIEKKLFYRDQIFVYFIGNESNKGIFNELDQVPPKKIACLYNSLAYILLQLFEEKVEFEILKKRLLEILEIKTNDDLRIILELFSLARQKTRNAYYPKADSYDGLIKVYSKMLEQNEISDQEKEEINKEINNTKSKIKDLDIKLNRKKPKTD